jgi:hypothetical protein
VALARAALRLWSLVQEAPRRYRGEESARSRRSTSRPRAAPHSIARITVMVRDWLVQHRRFHPHFRPTSAALPNLVESCSRYRAGAAGSGGRSPAQWICKRRHGPCGPGSWPPRSRTPRSRTPRSRTPGSRTPGSRTPGSWEPELCALKRHHLSVLTTGVPAWFRRTVGVRIPYDALACSGTSRPIDAHA